MSRAALPSSSPEEYARIADRAGHLESPALARLEQLAAEFAPTSAVPGRPLFRAVRPHQWAKNVLVLVPPALGGVMFQPTIALASMAAALALCLAASAGYLVNDILDRASDRLHWSKGRRPFASGALSPAQGYVAAAILVAVGAALGAVAGTAALVVLAAYLVATVLYSLLLKRQPIIDVVTLAGLFTLRLVLGVAASGVHLSAWLLTFSMLFFLSLSLAKRHTEVVRAAERRSTAHGRGYQSSDAPFLLAFGAASLIGAAVVLVLYMTQEAFVAAHLTLPRMLWALPLLVFLFGARVWLVSGRSQLDDDPIVFALKDRASRVVVMAAGASFLVAWLGVPGLP